MVGNPNSHLNMWKHARFIESRGRQFELPIFLPVYQMKAAPMSLSTWKSSFGIEGCITNAYFLYKNKETRLHLERELTIQEYLDFDGLVMTDSGAFQGFTRPLFLKNSVIVRFQEAIGADIVSPLDLVTPPGDGRTVAKRKLEATLKRLREARSIVNKPILAAVQQGGRFHELRHQALTEILEMGTEYIALGSLVPFFTKGHAIQFVTDVIHDARSMAGPNIPIHVYGAGDPLELPFYVYCGANVFDSSAFIHYALGGWYMTPYGSVCDPEKLQSGEFVCQCPICADQVTIEQIFQNQQSLIAHNLHTVMHTIQTIRTCLRDCTLTNYLDSVMELHEQWFGESALMVTWRRLRDR